MRSITRGGNGCNTSNLLSQISGGVSTEVTDGAIDKTLDILRKQRRTFTQRPHDAAAEDSDRVTVDFEGKIDGETFQGGKSEDFQFLVGEGQMLKEFEDAVRGMKSGESKTFPLNFPQKPTITASKPRRGKLSNGAASRPAF